MGLPPPNLPADENRAPELLAAFWVPVPFLTAALLARFYVRFGMRNVGWDDWMMLFSFVCFLTANILGTIIINLGGSRHIFYIQPNDQLVKILKLSIIAQPVRATAVAVGKLSIAGLTLRIISFATFWRKWFLYVCISILISLTIVDCTLKFVQCVPVRAVWDITIPPLDKTCWNPKISNNVSIANAAFGTFIDFVLAIVPCTFIWNLQLDKKTKIGLCAFLSIGILAGICSAIKTSQLHILPSRLDATWDTYKLYIWVEVEISLVIFCGCIPPIKPLFDWMRKGKPITPSGTGWSAKSKRPNPSSGFTSGTRSALSSKKQAVTMSSQEDESELVERPKDGRIMVSRHYDVESVHIPPVHSTRA
ncbi:hypothetical protein K504DRAFT_493354 [Pleomassaria siparia CBS 279.74]|uniref:Rhodopsin domain-containing protein n=1 Tax=Pleomassaria siparia CBS 279.74 TaxID=1314801 RepID=A0A6G1K049_9PLEO|nr:hypothetical protein K504DRAFT_493354 [Pleomassaria siparia CBS 279.74]